MADEQNDDVRDPDHLSQIATLWSVVRGATAPDHPDRQRAQKRMLELYGESVRRYLGACLREPHAVDEVYQEFALKLARGDFAGVDPSRGRFRGFVKSVLYRLVMDHHRRKKRDRRAVSLEPELAEPVAEDQVEFASDEEFVQIWRDGLLTHAWRRLEEDQQQRGHIYYSLLRQRVDHPEWSTEQVIAAVHAKTGKELAEGSLRVTLHRARKRFADYLLDAIAASLHDKDADLEDELISLDLMRYCKDALQRRE